MSQPGRVPLHSAGSDDPPSRRAGWGPARCPSHAAPTPRPGLLARSGDLAPRARRDLGELLGKPWPRQTVSAAEKGKRAFTAAELVALAIVLRTQANRLLLAPMELEQLEMPGGAILGRTSVTAALGYRGGDAGERFHGIAATGKAAEAIRATARLTSDRIEADQKELATLKALYEDLAERECPEPAAELGEGQEEASG